MASKRRIRFKECGRKQRFPNKEAASTAIKTLHRRLGYQGFICPYPCRWCNGWHFGHVKGQDTRNK